MHSFINPERERWVQAEYNFDIPAVIILIPRRLGMSLLTGESSEPERICRVLTDTIESHYPVLKGCVVSGFYLDSVTQMWSVYVIHDSLKRVTMCGIVPRVRMLSDGEIYLPTDNETDKLPIRYDATQPDIVVKDNAFKPVIEIERKCITDFLDQNIRPDHITIINSE